MSICSILLTDTGPLKTLAYADCLDLLLATKLPLKVTDMVNAELSAKKDLEGNRSALLFIERAIETRHLEIIKTGTPENAEALRSMRVDPGEQSIKIALEDYYKSNPESHALLLFEDNDIAKKTFILPDNVALLTTRPFLLEMEKRGHIKSAEEMLKRAEQKSLAANDTRSLLNRKKEYSSAPKNKPSVKFF